jgi:TRAP-type C4-dicarboxylate transport system permease small subunit
MLKFFLRSCDGIAKILMIVAAIAAFFLGFYMAADVVLRSFSYPIRGTAEYVREIFVFIVFLQLPYCVSSRSMINVDFLYLIFGDRLRRLVDVAGTILGAGLFALIVYGMIDKTISVIANQNFAGEGAIKVPLWPSHISILIGCGLAALIFALQSFERAFGALERSVDDGGSNG